VRFQCGWLQEPNLFPDELRPDRSGAIVLLGRKWRDWDVLFAIPAGKSVPAETLERLKLAAMELRIPLVFHERIVEGGDFAGYKVRGLGPPGFADAVRYAIGPEDVVKM